MLAPGACWWIANVRGGGEFGPAWHQAALKEKRQNSFDDFIAIAQDLARRGIAQPKQIGIRGGSNGGLLVGVALTQRPELFGAAVAQVPLLDMQRYNKLLAGASWMAEYGDPDIPEQWAYIAKYSPYQNVRKAERYPPTCWTRLATIRASAHARKMYGACKEGPMSGTTKISKEVRRSGEYRTACVDGLDRLRSLEHSEASVSGPDAGSRPSRRPGGLAPY